MHLPSIKAALAGACLLLTAPAAQAQTPPAQPTKKAAGTAAPKAAAVAQSDFLR